jgi:hypothetical protein
MAAIFGSAFPDVVKSVLVDRLVAWGTGKTPDATKPAGGTGFGEVTPTPGAAQAGANNWEAPRWGTQEAAATAWQQPQHDSPAQGGVVPAGAAVANPAMGNQSASFAAPAEADRGAPGPYPVPRGGNDSPYRNAGATSAGSGQPLVYPTRPDAASPADRGGMAPTRGPQSSEQPERFTAMERRLREYGATYYLLETWGNEGELYRFHCKMAIGNNPNYTRHFEATDRDALRAMAQVLERVEAWRAGRLQ